MISLATKYPNVYIDTSAYKPKRYPPSLRVTPADCLAQLDELGLDEEARRLFLGDNAMRVFRL